MILDEIGVQGVPLPNLVPILANIHGKVLIFAAHWLEADSRAVGQSWSVSRMHAAM